MGSPNSALKSELADKFTVETVCLTSLSFNVTQPPSVAPIVIDTATAAIAMSLLLNFFIENPLSENYRYKAIIRIIIYYK